MNNETKIVTKKHTIGWIASLAVPIILLLIPSGEAYTTSLKTFFAIVVFVMMTFAFELFKNNMIPSLIMCMLFLGTGIATSDQIFSGFANNIPWAMVGSLILVGVMNETNLLRRFSYWMMLKMGGKFRNLMFIFMLVTGVLSTVLPANIGFPIIIFAFGLIKTLDIEPQSNTAALLMLAAYFSMTIGAQAFLGPLTSIGVEVVGAAVSGFSISYTQYFIHNWLWIPFGFIFMYVLYKIFKNDHKPIDKEILRAEHKKCGKLTASEIKLIVLFVILFVFMLFSEKLGFQIGWMILSAAVVCFLPFMKLGTENALKEIRWPLVVFMVACLGIGTVAANVGAGAFVADAIFPLISKVGHIGALILIYILGVVINFVLTPLAAQGTMLVPLAQLGEGMGISPTVILYVFQNGVNQAFLPYEIAFSMFVFSFGMMKLKQFAKAGLAFLVCNFIWLFAVMIPYWHLIGIFNN